MVFLGGGAFYRNVIRDTPSADHVGRVPALKFKQLADAIDIKKRKKYAFFKANMVARKCQEALILLPSPLVGEGARRAGEGCASYKTQRQNRICFLFFELPVLENFLSP